MVSVSEILKKRMTNTYNFSFKNIESALIASRFLLQVHGEVDGYSDWTDEKLAKHLMRKTYIEANAPMTWFEGFNDPVILSSFFSDRCENVEQKDVELVQKVANTKPGGEEAYWYEKLSKKYTWQELKGLLFFAVQSSKYTLLPVPSENIIYFSLNGGKITQVSADEVAPSRTFLIDYNIGLNTMGSDSVEIKNTNESWYGVKGADKTYEKLISIMKNEFFHQ